MHQSMRWPRPRNASATLRTPSMASPSSSEVSSSATVPAMVADASATKRSSATTNAATLPFMSAVPRPYSLPSRTSGTNGSLLQLSRGPGGTTSVWPSSTSTGAPLPCVAHRLSTSPKRSDSQAKPARCRRSATSAWQPASSGVIDGAQHQFLRQLQHVAHVPCSRTRCLKLLSLKPCDTVPSSVTTTGPADQLRIFAQQQLPFRFRARRLAVRRQVAPRGRGLVDHQVPTADLFLPVDQGCRRLRLVAVVDERMRDAEAVEPVARFPAGVAVGEAVECHGRVIVLPSVRQPAQQVVDAESSSASSHRPA